VQYKNSKNLQGFGNLEGFLMSFIQSGNAISLNYRVFNLPAIIARIVVYKGFITRDLL